MLTSTTTMDFFPPFWHCATVLFSQVPKKCTDLEFSLLYILTLGTYSKYTRKNNFLALSVCFLQPCSSAGRKFVRLDHVYKTANQSFRFHNKKNSMKCVVYWIPLRIRVRSRNTQSHLKGGPEPSKKLIRKVLSPPHGNLGEPSTRHTLRSLRI